jgi:hypothetical protein
MRLTRPLFATIVGLILGTPAWANGRPGAARPSVYVSASTPTALQVDNDTGVLAEVFIDGAFRGKVRPTGEQMFPARPGTRQVTVKLPDGNLAYSGRVHLLPMQTTEIEIDPPVATLVLNNDGRSPLFVSIAGQPSFWMLPNARRSLQVIPGLTIVKTAVFGVSGLKTIDTHRVTTRMASTQTVRVGWAPAPPASQLTVKNLDNRTVRVYISGEEIASLRPGMSKTVEVRPGDHWVTMVSHDAGILYNKRVAFVDNQVRTVRVQDGRSHDQGAAPQRIPPSRVSLALR